MTESSDAATRVGTVLRRALVPVALLCIGVLLTAVMASFQRDSAIREQQLLFDRQVTQEHQNFIDQINLNIDEFEDAVAFMNVTYPGTERQYQQFFEGSMLTGGISNLDPGISLIEPVLPEEVPALEAREQALGNADFAVLSLGAPLNGVHYVITRTAEPVTIAGFPLTGLDIGSLASDILSGDLPQNGRRIIAIDNQPSLTALFESGAIGGASLQLVVILESVNDPLTGELHGWAARFFDPLLFIRELPQRANPLINVEVEMLGVTERMVDIDRGEATTFTDASLSRQLTDETHGLQWNLSMWADGDFGVGTGLFDQSETWFFGLLATAAFLLGSIWRNIQEHQLSRANFELEHARTLAHTDPLTGLLNRQGFLEFIKSSDNSAGGTLFFIDLDGFKAVNDSRGHAAGDRVLSDVARHLREQFRAIDIISRFGGDEFVIYTPGLAGRGIETGISQRVVEAIASTEGGVSCSLGTAVLMPNTEHDIDGVISRADAAMYAAKQHGGGQFARSPTIEPLPASPTIDLGQAS